ncbi:ABC transporter permease [Clostridium algidicarnis]|uniref:ABC transporter permease n=2 Tax=Clostridium algidicarnis TaxID=37659 RepID=UPI001629E929|nr:ABC transporter permease [Clostridium algidicarnis]MBB6697876.1 ABC transporter permease [Clostridium algidicarnis]MBU3204956.1 ABC transporter permease [Clostridium algidicarnis]MBU3213110.1 ABC transporter permease [Clostridium algidicarnis]MBU3223165.1 ABC transporter permease [Clostridium algidicarnis]
MAIWTSKNYKEYIKNAVIMLSLLAIGIVLSIYVVENPQDSLVSRLVTYNKIHALLLQHIYIVGISSALAILTAVPLGVFLTRTKFKKFAPIVVNIVNVGQTIPSIAVVALFVGILGVGAKTAIIALWIYSLLPILNNTLIGIGEVDRSIIEAANGMGMKARHVLTKVEIPLAMPMIIAGIRTSVTINIGSAILAAFVGGGGLGNFIITGNNISRWQVLVLGATLPVLMALFADFAFGIIEKKIKA